MRLLDLQPNSEYKNVYSITALTREIIISYESFFTKQNQNKNVYKLIHL